MLLLDEPTNHLDIEMRASLLMALQTFEGAVVVVSHDRALLRSICDRLLLVEQGKVREFDGDLDDYARYLSAPKTLAATDSNNAGERREQRRREAEARNRLSPLRKQLQETERRLNACLAQRSTVDAQLADNDFYTRVSVEEQQTQLQLRAGLQKEIDALENLWLELSENLAEHQKR
jgi:ATP-binding cassette subfamily F protein 3